MEWAEQKLGDEIHWNTHRQSPWIIPSAAWHVNHAISPSWPSEGQRVQCCTEKYEIFHHNLSKQIQSGWVWNKWEKISQFFRWETIKNWCKVEHLANTLKSSKSDWKFILRWLTLARILRKKKHNSAGKFLLYCFSTYI